jgi:hypothetical protein
MVGGEGRKCACRMCKSPFWFICLKEKIAMIHSQRTLNRTRKLLLLLFALANDRTRCQYQYRYYSRGLTALHACLLYYGTLGIHCRMLAFVKQQLPCRQSVKLLVLGTGCTVVVTRGQEAISEHEHRNFDSDEEDGLYLGILSWNGTEYPKQMTGPHGETTKYMSGWLNAVSYNLASNIVNEDWTHSVLMAYYGTSSEHLNLGHWINYAAAKHNVSVNYMYVTDRRFLVKIPPDECQKMAQQKT